MERYFGESTPNLGFGLMRLPKLENGEIDIEQVKVMVDMFLKAGLTYFDTAYVYDNGKSEEAARDALVKRHPRESFTLATKLNAWIGKPSREEAEKQLEISLRRTEAGYFDYYLLHAVQDNNYKIYEDYGLWDFVREAKKKGLIRHWGFSCHSSPDVLDELLTQHPDAEFVQLQINYADMDDASARSREMYEVARKHGKSIVIMEPVKGGQLASPVDDIKKVFAEVDPNASCASWAIRYVASMDGIITVLSGMSNIEQMADNVSYMKDFKPLDEREQAAIEKAQAILKSIDMIPCTACHYCTEGCPMQIRIPDIFACLNKHNTFNSWNQKFYYENVLTQEGHGKASDCIQCGQCEGICPQGLPIISLLQKAAETFE